MELSFDEQNNKNKDLEMKLKQMKQMSDSLRSNRNLLSKDLLTAKVVIILFYY